MKKGILFSLWVGLLCLALPLSSIAATEAQKQAAIDSGLAYLAGSQQGDGHFEGGGYDYDLATTGSAVLSFLEEGYSAGTDVVINATNYGDVVGNGLNYLLNQAQVYGISTEPAGNPDGDGNGIGVKFNNTAANNSRDTYLTGIVLPAIAASGTPDTLVTTGNLAGRTDGSGAGGAWTYRDVVQNTVDYFAYGQADVGNNARGGWRYYADYGQSDNSTAQWGPIAMLYASKMSVTAPQFVKDELKYWIDYIQNDSSGGSGYDRPTYLVNESKTGGLLLEMAFAEQSLGGSAYNLSNSDLIAALDYLDTNWQNTASSWNGNFNNPYAMWAIYKGLETTIGLDDTTHITNMRTFDGTTMALDAGDIWNWHEDYCEWLVDEFASNGGFWNGYSNWHAGMATAWGVNILNAVSVPGPGPEPVPEPGTILLLGIGLLGLVASRRKKK